MLEKLTPLIILLIFAIATYFMIEGMNSAVDMGLNKGS
jgi:diacylglycerol kinase